MFLLVIQQNDNGMGHILSWDNMEIIRFCYFIRVIRAHAIRRGNQYLFDIVTMWKMIGYNNKAISG